MPSTFVYVVCPSRIDRHAASTICGAAVALGLPTHSEIASGTCSTRSNTSRMPERGTLSECCESAGMDMVSPFNHEQEYKIYSSTLKNSNYYYIFRK